MNFPTSDGAKKGLKIRAAGRINTIGLSDRDLDDMLERMDASEAQLDPKVRRSFARWPFRHASVAMRLVHPGGSEVELRLACRNLSKGGISLLHSGYIHAGTPCTVMMPKLVGSTVEVKGEIVRCQHRRGNLHEIGVRFLKPINIRLFIDSARAVDFHVLEHVRPETVSGRLLLVEDCPLNTKIVKHYLRETRLVVTAVTTGAEGINSAADGYDVLVTDWQLPDMTGVKMLTQIREGGIQSPAIFVTADPAGALKEGLAELPNVAILPKPISQEQLLRAVAERVMSGKQGGGEQGTGAGAEQLNSDLASSMRDQAEALAKAAANKDIKSALPIAFMLIGAAAPLGHPQLGGIASSLVDAASSNQPMSRQLQVLNELARQLQSVFGRR